MTDVHELVGKEPWRLRQGQPLTILDPTWQGSKEICQGAIEWEGTSRWWWCQKCGYCGTATTTVHNPASHPLDDINESIKFFMEKRAEQGLGEELSMHQLLFVAAAAIRYAATMPPDKVGDYVKNQIVIR